MLLLKDFDLKTTPLVNTILSTLEGVQYRLQSADRVLIYKTDTVKNAEAVVVSLISMTSVDSSNVFVQAIANNPNLRIMDIGEEDGDNLSTKIVVILNEYAPVSKQKTKPLTRKNKSHGKTK